MDPPPRLGQAGGRRRALAGPSKTAPPRPGWHSKWASVRLQCQKGGRLARQPLRWAGWRVHWLALRSAGERAPPQADCHRLTAHSSQFIPCLHSPPSGQQPPRPAAMNAKLAALALVALLACSSFAPAQAKESVPIPGERGDGGAFGAAIAGVRARTCRAGSQLRGGCAGPRRPTPRTPLPPSPRSQRELQPHLLEDPR